MAKNYIHFKDSDNAVKTACGKKIDGKKIPAIQSPRAVTCPDCKDIATYSWK